MRHACAWKVCNCDNQLLNEGRKPKYNGIILNRDLHYYNLFILKKVLFQVHIMSK